MEDFDEILVSDESGLTKLPRIEVIIRSIEDVLQSEDFVQAQDSFVDENCSFFSDENDLPPECMNIYNKYVELIENKLLSKVHEQFPDFLFEELIPVITANNDQDMIHDDVFELLSATLDFNEFRELMVSYNKGVGIELSTIITKID